MFKVIDWNLGEVFDLSDLDDENQDGWRTAGLGPWPDPDEIDAIRRRLERTGRADYVSFSGNRRTVVSWAWHRPGGAS